MFGLSREQKIDQLLLSRFFTGTPSQILAEMKQFMGDGNADKQYDNMLHRLWLKNIDSKIRELVSALTADKNIDDAAKVTDTIHNEQFSASQPTTFSYSTLPF